MKKASLIVTPVVGLPQISGWAQVAANSHSSTHRFVCAFSVNGDNAGNIGRTISESIVQFNPGNTEDALHFFENLEATCSEQEAEFSGSAIFFNVKETAFMSLRGAVVLKRDSKVGQLLQSSDELQVLVGRHQPDDVIVLATQRAAAFLPEIEQKFKTGFDTDTIITSIVPGIHSQENSSLASLAFVVRTEIDVDSELIDEDDSNQPTLIIETEFMNTESSLANVDEISREAADEDTIAEPAISAQAVKSADSQILKDLGVNHPKSAEPPTEIKESNRLLKGFWHFLAAALRGLLALTKKLIIFLSFTLKNLKPAEIKNKIASSRIPSLDGANPKRKKIIPMVIAGLSLLGLIIILFLLIRGRQTAELAEAKALIEPITAQVVIANDQVSQNPIESRQQVRQSVQQLESILANAKDAKKSKGAVEAIEEALSFATTTENAISGQIEVNMLNTFYDLRLVSSDFVTSAAHSDGNMAAFFDQQKKQLIILNLENKQVRAITVDLQVKSLAVVSDKIYLLADGIYSLALMDEAATPVQIIVEGDSNRDAKIIKSYEIYLYAFNDVKRNVYRYARQTNNENQYSDPIGWMQAARGLEYDSVIDMAVDGDLWLSTQTGQLFKLAAGRTQDFAIIGLENVFSSPIKIATNVDQQRLYILEPEKRRVVVLEKDGTFLKEVVSTSLAAATDIFVSEKLGHAYAVSGSIIYEIPL